MSRIKVLQSFRQDDVPAWVVECLHSVREWSAYHDLDYRFVGNEFFDWVPAWYLSKVGDKLPVASDLARLRWLQAELSDPACEIAVWLDADTFILTPETLTIDLDGDCSFGRERWLQRDKRGRLRTYNNVQNAYCAFRAGSTTLPFLIDTTLRLVERVASRHIPPQFVGPKLLSSLHNTVGFEIDERFGAISPLLAAQIISGDGPPSDLCAANLSHSLEGEIDHAALIDRLRRYR